MKKIGEAESLIEQLAEEAIVEFDPLNSNNAIYEIAATSVISPIHRAVESTCFNFDIDDKQFFLKVRENDMQGYFNERVVDCACRAAANHKLSPILLYSNIQQGIYIFKRLSSDWSYGKVDDFSEPNILEKTIIAKKVMHLGKPLNHQSLVFKTITHYWNLIIRDNIWVPTDTPSLIKVANDISNVIHSAGIDYKACHGDGIASNVMINKQGDVQLVDFDRACDTDPYYDLGSFMLEVAQFDDDAREVLEIYEGQYSEALYYRCRLYGIADDLMWALWGFLCFAKSPRKEIEFIKYAEWRLLRCRWNIHHQDFEHWKANL